MVGATAARMPARVTDSTGGRAAWAGHSCWLGPTYRQALSPELLAGEHVRPALVARVTVDRVKGRVLGTRETGYKLAHLTAVWRIVTFSVLFPNSRLL